MGLTKQQIGKIVELCLLAGEMMARSGAETTRIEDTMMRISASLGMPESQCYVTQTGIFFSANRDERVKLVESSTVNRFAKGCNCESYFPKNKYWRNECR